MNIEHCIGLSWVRESRDAETKRPCARLRDAERERFAASVRRSCHGLSVSNGVHPSDGTGTLPVKPSRRIAAGYAAQVFCQNPRVTEHESENFSGSCENAREVRARDGLNGECCAYQAAPCNAPRPSS